MKISEVVEPSRIKKLKIELDEGAYCWPEKYQVTEFNVTKSCISSTNYFQKDTIPEKHPPKSSLSILTYQ